MTDKERNDTLDAADTYIVICRQGGRDHMYINGREDKLADLMALVFNEHPQLYQTMMERHQPDKVEGARMIEEMLTGLAHMMEQHRDDEDEGEGEERIVSRKTDSAEEETPEEAPAHSMEDMNNFLTDLGLDMKAKGKDND